MSIKKTLLAAALAAFAMTAMPALASAEVTGVHIKSLGGGNNRTFTIEDDVKGGKLVSTDDDENELKVECEELTGNGTFNESGTTGTIEITFTGCTAFGVVKCNSPGHSGGTITTGSLVFHVDPVNETPAVLITAPTNEAEEVEPFAEFKCSFLASIVVDGNGIIGTITEPEYTEETDHATIAFEQKEPGVQKHLTTDTDDTEWDLSSTLNGGGLHTAGLEDDATLTFDEDVELQDTGEFTGG